MLKAFRQRRDPAYQAWVRERPCLLEPSYITHGHWGAHRCLGRVQVCHVRSRGAGGDDRANMVPLCAGAHEEQHRIGIKSFQAHWGIDLQAEAELYWKRYCDEKNL